MSPAGIKSVKKLVNGSSKARTKALYGCCEGSSNVNKKELTFQ